VQPSAGCRGSNLLRQSPGMLLETWDLRILQRPEPGRIKLVVGKAATQGLKGAAADAKHGQRGGDGVVVPFVHFGVKVIRILCFIILLVEPVFGFVCQQRSQPRTRTCPYSLMPDAKSSLIAFRE